MPVTRLIEQHLYLVEVLVSERLRDVPAHVRRDDLRSAGLLALVLCATAYEPDRSVPFRSFAAYRIRGALIDELRDMDWASRSVRGRAREVGQIRAQLTNTLGRQPSNHDIAAALGVSSRVLDDLDADLARGAVLSLQVIDATTQPDVHANSTMCPESLILQREQLGYLHDAIDALPARLRFVIDAYFFGQCQMEDMARELGVTPSRVSQLCTEATNLLRDGMNSQLDPEALRSMAQNGRAAASRRAYYQTLADSNTVAGRLDQSTPLGEMRERSGVEYPGKTRDDLIA